MSFENRDRFSVVQALGHQMILQSGSWYDVNHLSAQTNDVIKLNRVLLYSDKENFTVGRPCVPNQYAVALVLQHFRGKKICVFKYKPKKKYTRKRGYRPALTRILVKKIFEKN